MKRVRALTRRLIRPIVVNEPRLAAKYLPYREEASDFAIPNVPPVAERDPWKMPVPPPELWVARGPGGYGDSDQEFLRIGRTHVDAMLETLSREGSGSSELRRVLDFGCASGRLIRWFSEVAQRGEVWGVDVSAPHVVWCQQHLSPPFHFCTTTTQPHLPFEDRYFDLIYAGSVFTHIDELADAWLLELRRCLVPGGHLYFTVNDKHSLEVLARNPEFNLSKRIAESGLALDQDFSVASIGRSYTLYDIDFLRRKLERIFEVRRVEQERYGFQTGVLLRRR